MKKLSYVIAVIIMMLAMSARADTTGVTAVELFSPRGTVKKVRQVAVRFTAPVVAFGDPRLADPFVPDCPEKGKGRWADGRNWVYDFERDLPAGVLCSFSMTDGLKDAAGEDVTGQREFTFSTGGPAVIQCIPYEGSNRIQEEQAFVLLLDCQAFKPSVAVNAYFKVEGIGERVGVRIIEGEGRADIIKALDSRWRPIKDVPETLIVQARQTFPANAAVSLVWGAGIESESGVKTERDQALPFKVRPPFKATFSCPRENPDAACIPLLPMSVDFESPISREDAQKIRLTGGGKVYTPKLSDGEYFTGVSFEGPFPEKTAFKVELPKGLMDDAGRKLENEDKFPLPVATADYPPLAKFSSRFGIIEKADPVLPVTFRNVEPEVIAALVEAGGDKARAALADVSAKAGRIESDEEIIRYLREVNEARRSKSLLTILEGAKSFKVPRPNGPDSFEVVGIPLPGTGLYVVELESRSLGKALLGKDAPMYVHTSALVTNLSAHFKRGRENSLVWVTRLDTGEPQPGARVAIRFCDGTLIWEGVTDVDGIAIVDKELPKDDKFCHNDTPWDSESYLDYSQKQALRGLYGGLFVFARTADDMTFVHTSWEEGIESWRFNIPTGGWWEGPDIATTVFDRTLLRAGETLGMKHILRKHVMAGFKLIDKGKLPKAVAIVHTGSDQSYEFPLTWDSDSGISETTWNVPEDAKLGYYEVRLLKELPKDDKKAEPWYGREYQSSGSFRVEEFRLPLMKGVIQPPAKPVVGADSVDVDIQVAYLSGGGAAGLPVKLRSLPGPAYVYFPDYPEYSFANGKVREGTVKLYGEQPDTPPKPEVTTAELTLGEGGALRAAITGIPEKDVPQDVLAEVEYRDPNGESQTVSRSVRVWSSGVVLGIMPDSWAASKEKLKFNALALDTDGKPLPNVRVTVEMFETKTYSHRRRLIGGFYSYEHVTETKKAGAALSGVTDDKGIVIFETVPPATGRLTLQASAKDANGKDAFTRRDVWVAGDDDWWYEVADHDRMDLLPERKRYEPGEVASFQARMPFREATALVTVEREGVMDASVIKLTGKEPVVKLPVKGNYAPNVFVSVLAVRGRSGEFKPTAMVDLGRPAYKLGMAKVDVGWKAHELTVKVASGRDVYKVREQAAVDVEVARTDGGTLPADAEVAIAAVDEGLLELMDNHSWDLLENMMGLRVCEVTTSTAQMQVVGKRHYGLKALPAGGGGGSQRTRELFDTLLFWRARVPLDAQGKAHVSIPLNDSLTSFRIVAVANAGAGYFGSGKTAIRTTQDVMLMSGLPPMVREGDKYAAGFTVRNASEREITLTVTAKAQYDGGRQMFPPLELTLGPGTATDATWQMKAPYATDSISWDVSATEPGGDASDRMKVAQKVVPAVPVRVFQAAIMQLDKKARMPIQMPADAQPGRGGIRVSVRRSIADELDGVKAFMKLYPYSCLEQQTSKAVALEDDRMWERIMERLPSYMDSDGLLKYFPTCLVGSDSLTAYVASIAQESGRKIPDGQLQRILNGLEGFVTGRVVRYGSMPTADLSIRKMAALDALSRYGRAAPNHLESITVEPNLWPTSGVIDWINVLGRVSSIPERDKKLADAKQALRARLNFQGTTMGFTSEGTDYMWWLMVSADVNAARTVIAAMDFPDWKPDMPRFVRGAVGRQMRGAWCTTIANAWGVVALRKFAKKFEAEPVTGTTTASLADDTRSVDWGADRDGGAVMLGWPSGKASLDIAQDGTGRPWATVQSLAAIPLKEPFSSGYRVVKKITPVTRKVKGKWSEGDVARVRLECSSQSDMTWVVVSDPVPAGSSILGGGLGGDSRILSSGEKNEGWAWPAFEERSFEAFRAYYEFVHKGDWVVEYTVRFNNAGTFRLPETRVEALYSPEMFGEAPNAVFTVNP